MPDTKKLQEVAERLLDTGKRNRLINFRDSKTLTAEVVFPEPSKLFQKMTGGETSFEVFDPKMPEEDVAQEDDFSQEQLKFSPRKIPTDKEEYTAQFSTQLKKASQILLYSEANPITAVNKISKSAHEVLEETGVNIAYITFGFIHWKECDSSEFVYQAPIILIPIQIEQKSAVSPIIIKPTDDDIVVNPTFDFKLQSEYHIDLPHYVEGTDLETYLCEIEKLVSKLKWTVSRECKIGTFSFLKLNMYRDLTDNAELVLHNDNVRSILGESAEQRDRAFGDCNSVRGGDPIITLHNVVDADSSQIEAIEMAKSGKSFVLQGPPGTGKSQTITNIIAECLSDGKSVLFVSEKRAALNVVFDKLKQAGLDDFCLELHSHKSRKKAVITELNRTLHSEKSSVSHQADIMVSQLETAKRQLDEYAAELHKKHPVIEASLYQLYEYFSAEAAVPDVSYIFPQLESKGAHYLAEAEPLMEQYVAYIPSIGYDYRKNAWYGFIGQDISPQAVSELVENCESAIPFLQNLNSLQNEFSEKYGISCSSIDDARLWKHFFEFAATSNAVTSAVLRKARLNAVRSTIETELLPRSQEIRRIRADLDRIFDSCIYHVDGESMHKSLVKNFSSALTRWAKSEYRQIMADLRLCQKDGQKLSYADAVSYTAQLAFLRKLNEEFSRSEPLVKDSLGIAYNGVDTDWDSLLAQLSELEKILSGEISLLPFQENFNFPENQSTFADFAQKLNSVFNGNIDSVLRILSGSFDSHILSVTASPVSLVLARVQLAQSESDRVSNWCHFRNLLADLDSYQILPFIHKAIAQNLPPMQFVGAFKKQFWHCWIDNIISHSSVLSKFSRIAQDNALKIFSEKDIQHLDVNKAKIRATLSLQRPDVGMAAAGSELAILKRQGEMTRNQMSIRKLLAATGNLVRKIKPCFMMSPLSVSTFLAPSNSQFDVVIFDEASQIFPQDAIGSIYRARQLIVVGDTKQMPPTNFFDKNTVSSSVNDSSDDDDISNFESILDICAASLHQQYLCWHYRSRYEQLIAFSNKNFYENRLITFPSASANAEGCGVNYYYVNGSFDHTNHTNRQEAEKVVDLIYQNIEKYPDRSLGVIAFSISQQNIIERLLFERRKKQPEMEYFFQDDGKEPFFVKNLETVQGDERDTIIFSIAYGFDSRGRLNHQFGPLTQKGGERRLNVAITRAKYNVQVVSSMHCSDIDLSRTSSEGAKLLREYLDFAENGNIALERTINVNPFEQVDSDFEQEVCDFLRANGFSVDTQVGCSGYRIDLGLKRPDSSDYVLAIECDGATYHSSKNARDRDRLRQEILERMGWKFYRIWSTDWFKNKRVEQERLLHAATSAVSISKAPAVPPAAPEEKDGTKVPSTNANNPFEQTVEIHFDFPPYKTADIPALAKKYFPPHFKYMVKGILEVEAPLSEELLLKRIAPYFDRTKVTSYVRDRYRAEMHGYNHIGIIRRNGFLYLSSKNETPFRKAGDFSREISQIAPEELADGMYQILKQNISLEKDSLYRKIANECGRGLGITVRETLDKAFILLEDRISVNGERITLK